MCMLFLNFKILWLLLINGYHRCHCTKLMTLKDNDTTHEWMEPLVYVFAPAKQFSFRLWPLEEEEAALFRDWVVLSCKGCPGHQRVFCSCAGLPPLDGSSAFSSFLAVTPSSVFRKSSCPLRSSISLDWGPLGPLNLGRRWVWVQVQG